MKEEEKDVGNEVMPEHQEKWELPEYVKDLIRGASKDFACKNACVVKMLNGGYTEIGKSAESRLHPSEKTYLNDSIQNVVLFLALIASRCKLYRPRKEFIDETLGLLEDLRSQTLRLADLPKE